MPFLHTHCQTQFRKNGNLRLEFIKSLFWINPILVNFFSHLRETCRSICFRHHRETGFKVTENIMYLLSFKKCCSVSMTECDCVAAHSRASLDNKQLSFSTSRLRLLHMACSSALTVSLILKFPL